MIGEYAVATFLWLLMQGRRKAVRRGAPFVIIACIIFGQWRLALLVAAYMIAVTAFHLGYICHEMGLRDDMPLRRKAAK